MLHASLPSFTTIRYPFSKPSRIANFDATWIRWPTNSSWSSRIYNRSSSIKKKQISTVSDYHTSWGRPGNERVPLDLHHETRNTTYFQKSIWHLIIFKNNGRRNGFVCYFFKQRFCLRGHQPNASSFHKGQRHCILNATREHFRENSNCVIP